jgi:CubicO group peptidase (beta-lactamase class C family)
MAKIMNCLQKTSAIILIALSQSSFAQQSTPGSVHNKTKSLIAELGIKLRASCEDMEGGSITAAIINGNEVIWTKSYGFVDKANKIPASRKTLYLIGSISKSITGLALAKLVEQGVLRLDDPVERYLPEIRNIRDLPANVVITFRQLATHTSGLGRETELKRASEGQLNDWEEKLLASIPLTDYIGEPQQKYSYSNIGYGILGLAMSRAANKPFDVLIEELVFEPLKMGNSGFELTNKMTENLAVSYENTRDYNLGRGYKFPNGGVYSNLEDMIKFAKTQLHTGMENYLQDSIWNEVQGFQIVSEETKDEKYGYGLGVSIWSDKSRLKWIYHNGIVAPGYSASMYCDLSSKMAIVILRNDRGSGDIGGIADEFLYKLTAVKNGN